MEGRVSKGYVEHAGPVTSTAAPSTGADLIGRTSDSATE